MNSQFRLAVDFGACHTTSLLIWPDGRAQQLLFDSSPLLLSAVFGDAEGHLIVGRDAAHSARLEPSRFEPYPKRRVDDGVILLGEREHRVALLWAAVLRRVRDEAARVAGAPVMVANLTHPGGWGGPRKAVLHEAARQAGFESVALTPEPVAAAVCFSDKLSRRVPLGSAVVVYDFGGGTFDVSVVRREDSRWHVSASDGLDGVGGIDLDGVVVDLVGEVLRPRSPENWNRLASPSDPADHRSRQLLWEDARAVKEQLSRRASATVHVPIFDDGAPVTREQFEARARPWLERTVSLTEETLRRSGVSAQTVAGLFLVGGSSRIPLAATMLHQRLGIAPTVIEQPELVVAQGAAMGHDIATAQPLSDPAWAAQGARVPPGQPAFPAAHVVRPQPADSSGTAKKRLWWGGGGLGAAVAAAVALALLYPTGSHSGDQPRRESATGKPAVFKSTVLRDFARNWLGDVSGCEPGDGGGRVDQEHVAEMVTCDGKDGAWRVQFIRYDGAAARDRQRERFRAEKWLKESTTDAGGVRFVGAEQGTGEDLGLVYWDSADDPVAGVVGAPGTPAEAKAIWDKHES